MDFLFCFALTAIIYIYIYIYILKLLFYFGFIRFVNILAFTDFKELRFIFHLSI